MTTVLVKYIDQHQEAIGASAVATAEAADIYRPILPAAENSRGHRHP